MSLPSFGPRSRYSWGAGGLLLGLIVGGVASRWATFWRWAQSADWSSLPAVTIGTAVPAIAGVVFAQTLAKRSVRTLREVELDTTERYNRQRSAAAGVEREARRAAWEQVYDLCKTLQQVSPEGVAFLDAVTAEARAADQRGAVRAEKSGLVHFSVEYHASEYARYGALWGEQLRLHLPSVIEALDELVHQHQVESMRVPLRSLERLLGVSLDRHRWLPLDTDAVVRAASANSQHRAIVNIGSNSVTAIHDLQQMAHVHRAEPHNAEDVDASVGRRSGLNTYQVNALTGFADLDDLIERDGSDDN